MHILDISSKDYDRIELMRSIGRLIESKYLKLSRSKIQDGRHNRRLENKFSTSLLKPLVDLSRNLLWSNRMT